MKCKKLLDGTYTRMLRMAYNISWKSHPINKSFYGSLPCVTETVRQRRLSLAGHVTRHEVPAGRLLLWTPPSKRRLGRPYITLKNIIEEETGLSGKDLLSAMADRQRWHLDYVCASPEPSNSLLIRGFSGKLAHANGCTYGGESKGPSTTIERQKKPSRGVRRHSNVFVQKL